MLCHSLFVIMRYLVNSQEMKQLDQNTIEYYGIPSLVLMERAALCVFAEIKRLFQKTDQVLVICGAGNNGGDGFAIARLLHLAGYLVDIHIPMDLEKMTSECRCQYEAVKKYQIPIIEKLEKPYQVIVDALFGVGLSRPLEGGLKELIQWCNSQKAVRIAVDIPSGVSADTGEVLGEAFFADITVTFGFTKVGQMLYPGAEACGEVITADIGIDERSILDEKPGVLCLEDEDAFRIFPGRKNDSNKGSYGKVLVIAGSDKMAGAAYFASKAAYVSGCGLVQIFTPKANRDILLTKLPEAIVTDYDEKSLDISLLREKIHWSDVVLIGPGIGVDTAARTLVREVFSQRKKSVVADADGLNILAEDKTILKNARASIIVTPHLGEMSRLTGEEIPKIKENLMGCARDFSEKYGVICVLKDSRTVIGAEEELYINPTGCNGMAVGGSGDVLAGLITGLLAQKVSPKEAAILGTFLHGRAGEEAARLKGNVSMLASDLLEQLPAVIKSATERK